MENVFGRLNYINSFGTKSWWDEDEYMTSLRF